MRKSGKKMPIHAKGKSLQCKESSDLNCRGKLKAIHSEYLKINIVWYFQKKNWYRYLYDILKMIR